MGQYTQLSVSDRRRLFIFLEMGLSVTQIAYKISRHRSTVYRELNRNKVIPSNLKAIKAK